MSGPFVSQDEPHGTLEAVINADVTDEIFPALLMKVDGEVIPSKDRRTYLLAPGEHTISLKPDREKLQKFEDNFGRNYTIPRIFFEKAIQVNVEEGETYKFGVRITNYNYAEWTPMVEKVER